MPPETRATWRVYRYRPLQCHLTAMPMPRSTYERVPQPPPLFDRLDPARDLEGEDTLILWWSMSEHLTAQGHPREAQLGALAFVMQYAGGVRLHVTARLPETTGQLNPEMRMFFYAMAQYHRWCGHERGQAYDAAWRLIEHVSEDLGSIRLYIRSPDRYIRRVARELLAEGLDAVQVAQRTELGLRPAQRFVDGR